MKVLITGGAGFIGSNVAAKYLAQKHRVKILDNLSRSGATHNLKWLNDAYPGQFEFIEGDIRDEKIVRQAVDGTDVIFHLAAQVAVTSSVEDPLYDFSVNAGGTLNVLEAARKCSTPPIVVYSSTNKVYGELESLGVVEQPSRYAFSGGLTGVSEQVNLDFHSPYGCSKGTADQYVRDYARIYDLPTVVFRQSCIYGPHQFGIVDQGWVVWLMISALQGKLTTIYGNGKQVRDILHVDDLVRAYQLAIDQISLTKGQIYNIGGGKDNTISIWAEFGPMIEKLLGQKIPIAYAPWRPGDQKIYVSDVSKAKKDFDWEPKINVNRGLSQVFEWVQANQSLFN